MYCSHVICFPTSNPSIQSLIISILDCHTLQSLPRYGTTRSVWRLTVNTSGLVLRGTLCPGSMLQKHSTWLLAAAATPKPMCWRCLLWRQLDSAVSYSKLMGVVACGGRHLTAYHEVWRFLSALAMISCATTHPPSARVMHLLTWPLSPTSWQTLELGSHGLNLVVILLLYFCLRSGHGAL